jgi:hypothetical protein
MQAPSGSAWDLMMAPVSLGLKAPYVSAAARFLFSCPSVVSSSARNFLESLGASA